MIGWQVLAVRRETLGEHHPGSLLAMSNYGRLLQEQGRLEEAEPLLREVLEIRRARLGPQHQATMASIANLGGLLREKGNLTEAAELFREDLQMTSETLGPRHPDTLIAIGNMADLLREMGELEEAFETFGDAVEVRGLFSAPKTNLLIDSVSPPLTGGRRRAGRRTPRYITPRGQIGPSGACAP